LTGTQRARGVFAAACALALLTIVGAYSNSFENSFHFDDSHVIQENLYVRSVKNIPLFFRDPTTFSALPANSGYRPLVSATLAIDYWLGDGLSLWQFHLSQLIMLILLGALLYPFVLSLVTQAGEGRSWSRYAALASALLFSIHTTNTETMNTISARSELLSTMGVVGSFLLYLYLPRWRPTQLFLLPMVVGATAKTPAVMFAPLFFVYVLLFEERLSLARLFSSDGMGALRRAAWKALPAFLAGVVMFFVVESATPKVDYGISGLEYARTQLFSWLHYARLFVLPLGLSADTDMGVIAKWYDTRVVAGALFVAFLLWATVQCSRTSLGRPIAFGLAWFALALLPGSSIVPLAEVVNDHRVFFPFIGLAISVSWGAGLLLERWYSAGQSYRAAAIVSSWVIAILVVGAHAVGTFQRNRVWLTEETLWRDVTEKSPGNGRGWMNYGLTQMAQGRYLEAKQLFERARLRVPNYATLEINLGVVTAAMGDHATAEQHFLRALQLEPNYPAAHTFFAHWLKEQGRVAEAVSHLERAVALGPADMGARYQLLEAYAASGQTDKVRDFAAKTLEVVPDDAKVLQYLESPDASVAAAGSPRPSEIVGGLLNTSLSLYRAGDWQGSIDAAKRALELDPSSAVAYNNIAAAFTAMGRWDEAVEAAGQALRIAPDFSLARNNLAWAEAERQKARQGQK
jgi:tetratricopeptide (TPR) repeat protein